MGIERDQLRAEINATILKEYDLPARKIKAVRDGYKVETVRGTKFIKKAEVNQDELMLAFEAVEYLNQKGFNQALRFNRTKFGDPFVIFDGQIYYLMDWLDGKDYDLGRLSRLTDAARLLRQMQESAVGFKTSSVPPTREKWDKWPVNYSQHLADLQQCWGIVEDRMFLTEFDQVFLGQISEILKQAERAVEIMNRAEYWEVVAAEQARGNICHHNFTSRNLIKAKHQVYVTNFDNCQLDIRLYDLGRIILRNLPRYHWDGEVFIAILSAYCEGTNLNKEERLILWSFLSFPHRWLRFARRNYLEGRFSESKSSQTIKNLMQSQLEYQAFIQRLPEWLEVT